MKYIFIDTNVFLSFYHYSNDDIEQLRKLVSAIESKRVVLFITDQVVNEFIRNRDRKLADAVRKMDEFKLEHSFPIFMKEYSGFNNFIKKLREVKNTYAELKKSVQFDITIHKLESDKLIKDLFAKATRIRISNEIYERALMRHNIGNPPGKKDSLGDALNWEALLEHHPNGEPLYFVTNDNDYSSEIDKHYFNSFLYKEWAEKKDNDVVYNTSLSNLFDDILPDIKFAIDIEIEAAISSLEESGSFRSTHEAVKQLHQFDTFTDTQVKKLIAIGKDNPQVFKVITDKDLENFYVSLWSKYYQVLSSEERRFIEKEILDKNYVLQEHKELLQNEEYLMNIEEQYIQDDEQS